MFDRGDDAQNSSYLIKKIKVGYSICQTQMQIADFVEAKKQTNENSYLKL